MNHTLDRFAGGDPTLRTDGGVAETEPTAELPDWLARHLRDDLDLPLDHPDTDIGWNDDRPSVRVTTPDGEYNGWPIRFECAACGFCDVRERFVERNTLHEQDLENLANAETRSEEREFRRKAKMSKHASRSHRQCPECGGETVERFDDPDRDPVLVRDDDGDGPEIVTDGGQTMRADTTICPECSADHPIQTASKFTDTEATRTLCCRECYALWIVEYVTPTVKTLHTGSDQLVTDGGQDVGGRDNTGPDPDATDHSPAGFNAPTVELNNGKVLCVGCKEAVRVDEAKAVVDKTISKEDDDGTDVVGETTRRYVCSGDCLMESMFETGDLFAESEGR